MSSLYVTFEIVLGTEPGNGRELSGNVMPQNPKLSLLPRSVVHSLVVIPAQLQEVDNFSYSQSQESEIQPDSKGPFFPEGFTDVCFNSDEGAKLKLL